MNEKKLNEFGLSENSMNIICSIYKKYACVLEVVVYGSRAMGNYKKGSDIDMTIKGDENFSHDILCEIVNDFYESDLIYLVDVSDFSQLQNQNLIDHINRVGKVIYKK